MMIYLNKSEVKAGYYIAVCGLLVHYTTNLLLLQPRLLPISSPGWSGANESEVPCPTHIT